MFLEKWLILSPILIPSQHLPFWVRLLQVEWTSEFCFWFALLLQYFTALIQSCGISPFGKHSSLRTTFCLLCSSCAFLVSVELCAGKLRFSVCCTLLSIKENHVVAMMLAPCALFALPCTSNACSYHLFHYSIPQMPSTENCDHITPFTVGIALVWFILRKRDRSPSRCWEFGGRECRLSFRSI